MAPESTGWLREEESLRGRLLGPIDKEGASYFILFPYSMPNVRTLRRGQMIAVRNFSNLDAPSYSVLEITASRPVHYALEVSLGKLEGAYPGFLLEAAKSVAQDWEQSRPAEEVTRIRAEATLTGLQIVQTEAGMKLTLDDSLPMQGQEAIPLTLSGTAQVINYGLDAKVSMRVGELLITPEVHVMAMPERFITTHAGIFGFTGAGKSNLFSTLVSELLKTSAKNESLQGLRIVLLDYMFEYFPLLADVFHEQRGAVLLFLSPNSLPGGERSVNMLLGREGNNRELAQLLLRGITIPDNLRNEKTMEGLTKVLMEVIDQGRIKIIGEVNLQSQCRELLEGVLSEYSSARLGRAAGAFSVLIEEVTPEITSQQNLTQLARDLKGYARTGRMPKQFGPRALGPRTIPDWVENISPTAKDCLQRMARELETLASVAPRLLDLQRGGVLISLNKVVEILNSSEKTSRVILVLSEDPDQLREFFSALVNRVYHSRRSRGQNRPLTLFMVDEADEFLPREAADTYLESRGAAETLARRGRKFGMGLWIATQRAAYLDTKTIGQLHTYFVSKLPREHDRATVAAAYGLSQDAVDKCLELRVGEWLVVSHNATGLKGVPIPVRAPNAEERVRSFLVNVNKSKT